MILHLLRHTRPNVPEGICYGQSDVDVASSFKSEVEQIRHKLDGIHFSRVYCSPLQRCVHLARGIGIPPAHISLDDRLMEMHFGEWEMKHWNEIEQHPEAGEWFSDYLHRRVPGGESYSDVQDRVRTFLMDLIDSEDSEAALIICHKGVMLAFMALSDPEIGKEELFRKEIAYGEIHTIALEESL